MDQEEQAKLATMADIFGSVFFLSQHLARRADSALEHLDLTTKQWLLLAILVKRFPKANPTLSEAAHWYGSSRQNIKKIAKQLQTRGYLRLVPDTQDKRALRLELTEKVGVFDEPDEVASQNEFLRKLFAALGRDDLDQLRGLLSLWQTSLFPH